MKLRKTRPVLPDFDDLDDYDFLEMSGVASSTDCTGLIPTPPLEEADADSYTDIYNIPQPGNPIF